MNKINQQICVQQIQNSSMSSLIIDIYRQKQKVQRLSTSTAQNDSLDIQYF